MEQKNKNISFLEHLEELRGRILKVLGMMVVTSSFFYSFREAAVAFLIKPVGKVYFLSPLEAFMGNLILSLWGGFFLALPFLLYQLWAFVLSGLTAAERRYVLILAPLSLIFFVGGGLFGYYLILPIMLKFCFSFSSAWLVPMITFQQYIGFVGVILFSFGLVFELPLILVFLTQIGVVTPEFLRQKRKFAVLWIFIASAVATPPDVISQFLMAIPLLVLYEAGIILSSFIRRPSRTSND